MFKFLTPIFLIALSGGVFFLFINPNYKETKLLKVEFSQYDEALTKSKELREVRDNLLSQYNSFEIENVERLEKIVPDNVNNVRLIMEVDSIASKYGVILRKVEVKAFETDTFLGKDTNDFGAINLDLLVEASYEDFLSFLNDLSNSLRIMDVDNLSFESNSLGFYRFKINLKTYWLK